MQDSEFRDRCRPRFRQKGEDPKCFRYRLEAQAYGCAAKAIKAQCIRLGWQRQSSRAHQNAVVIGVDELPWHPLYAGKGYSFPI